MAGQNVADDPSNTFTSLDVTINSPSAVTVNIQARFVPQGTVVKVVMIPENGTDVVVDSTPLGGTLAQSTAMATLTMPPGFSWMYVRAKWTP